MVINNTNAHEVLP